MQINFHAIDCCYKNKMHKCATQQLPPRNTSACNIKKTASIFNCLQFQFYELYLSMLREPQQDKIKFTDSIYADSLNVLVQMVLH